MNNKKILSTTLLPFILVLSVLLIVYCEWDICKSIYDKFLLVVIVILVANIAIKYVVSENVVEGFRASSKNNSGKFPPGRSGGRGNPFIDGVIEEVETFTDDMQKMQKNKKKKSNSNSNNSEFAMSIDNKFNSILKNSSLDKAIKNKDKNNKKNSFDDIANSTTTPSTTTPSTTTPSTTTPEPTQGKIDNYVEGIDLNRMLDNGNEETDDNEFAETIQKNVRGITSIFRPQIIIKDENDKTGVYYKEKDGDNERKLASYDRNRNRGRKFNNDVSSLGDGYDYSYDTTSGSSSLATQEPTHDLWATNEDGSENTRPDYVLGDPYQNYATPSQQLMANSATQPYNILPASCKWDVPQQRAPVCIASNPIANPVGVGNYAPLVNMLELNPDGTQSASESRVQFTNIGSIMPKFNYSEVGYN